GDTATGRPPRRPCACPCPPDAGHALNVAYRFSARARAFAASMSRSFGGAFERLGVRLRRLGRSAHLAHELQCGRVHLVVGRGGLEVVEGMDVPAHATSLTPGG